MNIIEHILGPRIFPVNKLLPILLACIMPGISVSAYERPNQRPVLVPEYEAQGPANEATENFVDFYASAGKPRIVLFWDVAFDQHTEMEGGGLEYTYDANYGAGYRSSRERLGGARYEDPSENFSGISVSDTAEIESAFVSTLIRAGIGLVDRGTVIRSLHASEARSEKNRKLIETDAIWKYADLILEVLTTRDEKAPLGYGFRVSCRNLTTGENLVAFYFTGAQLLESSEGAYVATERGFEWFQPAVGEFDMEEIGNTLAETTLGRLGPRMGNINSRESKDAN